MSNPPTGQGAFNQSRQSYSYNNGGASVQYTPSQTSWSSTGQPQQAAAGQQFLPPPIQTPPLSLPQGPFNGMQMHSEALSHHQLALQHHNAVTQGMQNMSPHQQPMLSTMRSLQPQLSQAPPFPHHPHAQSNASQGVQYYGQMPAGTPMQRLQIAAEPSRLVEVEAESDEGTPSNRSDSGSSDGDAKKKAKREKKREEKLEKKLARQLERRLEKRLEKEAAKNRRLLDEQAAEGRGLIGKEAKKAHEQFTRQEQSIQALKEENERLHKQQMTRELADKHHPSPTSAARPNAWNDPKVHEVLNAEVAGSIAPSHEEILSLVRSEMQSQLAGLSRTADLDAVAARIEKAAAKLPSEAPSAQIQKTINKHIERAVKTASENTPQEPGQSSLGLSSVAQPKGLRAQSAEKQPSADETVTARGQAQLQGTQRQLINPAGAPAETSRHMELSPSNPCPQLGRTAHTARGGGQQVPVHATAQAVDGSALARVKRQTTKPLQGMSFPPEPKVVVDPNLNSGANQSVALARTTKTPTTSAGPKVVPVFGEVKVSSDDHTRVTQVEGTAPTTLVRVKKQERSSTDQGPVTNSKSSTSTATHPVLPLDASLVRVKKTSSASVPTPESSLVRVKKDDKSKKSKHLSKEAAPPTASQEPPPEPTTAAESMQLQRAKRSKDPASNTAREEPSHAIARRRQT